MSDSALYTSLIIVGFGVAVLIWFVVAVRVKRAKNKSGYNWQPEQDFDVVMRGEGPMTPGFPTLIPRKKPDHKDAK